MAIAAPENSASAIEMCIQDFCEWAEIDVRLTKDGRHVVIHNDTACHKKRILLFSDALGRNESVDEYKRAIGWGIDCIQTDHPLRVLRALEQLAAKEMHFLKPQ